MESLSRSEIIHSLVVLGNWISNPDQELTQNIQRASNYNPWYTSEMVSKSLNSIATWLDKDKLTLWSSAYTYSSTPKIIGLILAGNIPLVGIHDIICVLMSGHIAQIKTSSDDAMLTSIVLHKWIQIEPKLNSRIQLVNKLQNFDAIIATGSNNTSRYFDYYFGKYPHIIRKNRHSIAVLNGKESKADLKALGNDIFDYYGLGCRNISKVFIPKNYSLPHLLDQLEEFNSIAHHHKYINNYDYNKSVYLVNKIAHFDTGFLILKEDEGLSSPLSVLFFEYYDIISSLEEKISQQANEIQCVVSSLKLQIPLQTLAFGSSQCPTLADYADNIDTMKFLSEL